MNKLNLKKEIFTIPNIITYFRLICVPLIMVFTIMKSTFMFKSAEFPNGFPFIGFVLMVVAASSDLVDGYIARRFNQVSNLGKMLDPVADKLMHVLTILSLVIIGNIHYAFVVVLMFKELVMILGGLLIARYGKVIQAVMMGKIASATLSVAVFLSFFHDFFAKHVFYLDWIILGIGLVLTYIAFVVYLKMAYKAIMEGIKEKKDKKENIENDASKEL